MPAFVFNREAMRNLHDKSTVKPSIASSDKGDARASAAARIATFARGAVAASIALVLFAPLWSCVSVGRMAVGQKVRAPEPTQEEPSDEAKQTDSFPDIAQMLSGNRAYDEATDLLGGEAAMVSFADWPAVFVKPIPDGADAVAKVEVEFWASDAEYALDDAGGDIRTSDIASFFVIENEGRLEKRANKSDAKTLELRMNGTEFELEADLGSVESVSAGRHSYPMLTEEQVTELEATALAAGGSRNVIDSFDRETVAELLVDLGFSADVIEEVSSYRYRDSLEAALDQCYRGFDEMTSGENGGLGGLIAAPAAFSTGYRWEGRLVVDGRSADVSVDAKSSAHISLQSAAGVQNSLVPDQIRFTPQGQCVAITINADGGSEENHAEDAAG